MVVIAKPSCVDARVKHQGSSDISHFVRARLERETPSFCSDIPIHNHDTMPSRSPTPRRDAASRSPYSRASRSPSRTPRRSISPRPSPSPQRRSPSHTRTRSPARSRSRSRSYRARSTSRGRDRSPTPPMPRSSKVRRCLPASAKVANTILPRSSLRS